MRKAFKNFIEGMKKDERGMTLVELLAVIVILAIVGAIAFVAIGNVIENSRQDAQIANAQQAISAAELYEASNGEIDGGASVPDDELTDYLEPLVDPWESDEDITVEVKRAGSEQSPGDLLVSITGGSEECEINSATETQLRTLERDVICGTADLTNLDNEGGGD